MTSVIRCTMNSKQTSETWDAAIRKMLDSKEMYDVIFLVGEAPAQEIFPAHKLIFSAVSPAFKHLFKGVPRRGIISIPQVDPDDFGALISHIYGKEVRIHSLQHSWNLLPLASKYGLQKLAEECRKYIIDCIDIDNVCGIFEEAEYQEEGDIILKSLKFMTENAKYLFGGKGLIGAHSNTIAAIISQDCINVDSEYQLFSAILEWAKVECTLSKYRDRSNTLREIIEPLLPYIRFLQIRHYQLVKEPVLHSIFTKEEFLSISTNLVSRGSYKLPIWCNTVAKRRKGDSGVLTEKQWSMPCLCRTNDEDTCREATITYRSKMGIFVSGIGFRLSVKHSLFVPWFSAIISVKTEEKVETTVLENLEIVTISEQIAKFRNPVYVKSGGWFEITIKADKLSPAIHCCKLAPLFNNAPFSVIRGQGDEKCSSCFCVLCYLSLA